MIIYSKLNVQPEQFVVRYFLRGEVGEAPCVFVVFQHALEYGHDMVSRRQADFFRVDTAQSLRSYPQYYCDACGHEGVVKRTAGVEHLDCPNCGKKL